jgi:hypothetical protein
MQNVLIGIQGLLLGITCASVNSLMNLPYQLIFVIQGLVLVLSDKRSLRTYLNTTYYLNRCIIFLIIAEILAQYINHLYFQFKADNPSPTQQKNAGVIGFYS